MQTKNPRQHTHNWKTEWHAVTELATQKQRHVDETWYGLRVRRILVSKCYRGNKVKHTLPIRQKPEIAPFIPMSGAVPPNWPDGKQVKYE